MAFVTSAFLYNDRFLIVPITTNMAKTTKKAMTVSSIRKILNLFKLPKDSANLFADRGARKADY